jgi:hypothetical protein
MQLRNGKHFERTLTTAATQSAKKHMEDARPGSPSRTDGSKTQWCLSNDTERLELLCTTQEGVQKRAISGKRSGSFLQT